MSLSINTNNAAMAALQSLDQTTAALNQTESRVSTGKDVSSASDNPAVYAIAQTMNSQIGALSGVQSGLNFASQVVATASQAMTSISGILSSLSETVTSAETTGYNASTMNAALTQAATQINAIASGATFQGVNLVGGTLGAGVSYTSVSAAQDVNGTLFTQSGFNATAAGLGLSGLNVNQAGLQLSFSATPTSGSASAISFQDALTEGSTTVGAGDGASITLNNTAWTSAASASASNPAIESVFIATNYTSAGTAALTSETSGGSGTGGTQVLASQLATLTGATTLTVNADGSLTGVGAATVSANGDLMYHATNGAKITVSKDDNGNFNYSVVTATDANGNATKETSLTLVNVGTGAAGSDAATNMITAMQSAGFGVSQSAAGALTIAGNNLDASNTAGVFTAATSTGTTYAGTASEATGANVALLAVQAAISKMNTIASTLGSSANQLSVLSGATSSLSNALTSGVGALTDADLAAESAKLTALQTKQQLAIQSLSIANSQSSSILSLFRG
ncbi:flagellin [Acidomonas methanolica]|uniref:Flagellin n=1 Tax=Acidomonas methanolica NBRC 104435 TaxID=1231351 RepID=A0A023D470_ACIMT|nr:flagellin [Acidomonas methanolica]MBU2654462.1 flagellin [Acidomonas methanolica]TCS28265.1 flagellin [Acidomonas methanolica]GAJ28601.1 flagellin B [Acidomonas methanolica NBRC 104435]GBQ45901.1 flagellin B [Acidomonas methanolica]GEK98982.1 hypothetical protein AME01nite_14810 [Acidomonas methanolica NBRC 104435]